MNADLTLIAGRLAQAHVPEEIFGEISGAMDEKIAGLKKMYHNLAKITHPDAYRIVDEQSLAQIAFSNLTYWYHLAEEKISLGEYGKVKAETAPAAVRLATKTRQYWIEGDFKRVGIYNHYPCRYQEHGLEFDATLKITRDPLDNDLAENEARILNRLVSGKAAKKFWSYLPRLIETFVYDNGSTVHAANVFERASGWYSLEQVLKAYPGGIDPKDMAWMWRRLLVALGFAHLNEVIHGAVVPANVFILPKEHGLILDGWTYAVLSPGTTGDTIQVIDPAYAGWYPREITQKELPSAATDIDLSAKCMIYVLGGDPATGFIPPSVPGPIRTFLSTCIFPKQKARPQNAWALKEEFDETLERLWGERKFHPFFMK